LVIAMSVTQAIGIGIGLFFVAFIVFCFRQGDKVKPRQGPPESRYLDGGRDDGG
jgi:hypothetical protein